MTRDFNLITNKQSPGMQMQQSNSAYSLFNKDAKLASRKGLEEYNNQRKSLPSNLSTGDLQAGNDTDYSCMWVNHFAREENQMYKRDTKYLENLNMILSNQKKFGTGLNDVNDSKKKKLTSDLIRDGHGNEFVEGMSGCPIQKVHKMRTKKREKLRKYLLNSSSNQLPFEG